MKLYFNHSLEKKQLKKLFYWFHQRYGYSKTRDLADTLKTMGFHYATYAGISLAVDDLEIPPLKGQLVKNAEKQVSKSDQFYQRGEITSIERFQKVIEAWSWTSENVKEEVLHFFQNYQKLNPVYMMAFSGARGNISQVRQLVGMRGLMSDPQGNLIDVPIKNNFREGLTIIEYVISCYGARKGIVDTALKTANSGYLTRRLVEAAQAVTIYNTDCHTNQGQFLSDLYKDPSLSSQSQTATTDTMRNSISNLGAESEGNLPHQSQLKDAAALDTTDSTTNSFVYLYNQRSSQTKEAYADPSDISSPLEERLIGRVAMENLCINDSTKKSFSDSPLLNKSETQRHESCNYSSNLNTYTHTQFVSEEAASKTNLKGFLVSTSLISGLKAFSNVFGHKNMRNAVIQPTDFVCHNLPLNDKQAISKTTSFLAHRNEEIQPFQASHIAKYYDSVRVRSPLTCSTSDSKVCQLCYGWNLSQNRIVSLGEVVGIIAAQSIGEPGTQLTMRTFHTGGVFAGDVGQKVVAPSNGYIYLSDGSFPKKNKNSQGYNRSSSKSFSQRELDISVLSETEKHLSGRKVRTQLGENALITYKKFYIAFVSFIEDKWYTTIYEFPSQTLLFVTPGEYVEHKQIIAEIPRKQYPEATLVRETSTKSKWPTQTVSATAQQYTGNSNNINVDNSSDNMEVVRRSSVSSSTFFPYNSNWLDQDILPQSEDRSKSYSQPSRNGTVDPSRAKWFANGTSMLEQPTGFSALEAGFDKDFEHHNHSPGEGNIPILHQTYQHINAPEKQNESVVQKEQRKEGDTAKLAAQNDKVEVLSTDAASNLQQDETAISVTEDSPIESEDTEKVNVVSDFSGQVFLQFAGSSLNTFNMKAKTFGISPKQTYNDQYQKTAESYWKLAQSGQLWVLSGRKFRTHENFHRSDKIHVGNGFGKAATLASSLSIGTQASGVRARTGIRDLQIANQKANGGSKGDFNKNLSPHKKDNSDDCNFEYSVEVRTSFIQTLPQKALGVNKVRSRIWRPYIWNSYKKANLSLPNLSKSQTIFSNTIRERSSIVSTASGFVLNQNSQNWKTFADIHIQPQPVNQRVNQQVHQQQENISLTGQKRRVLEKFHIANDFDFAFKQQKQQKQQKTATTLAATAAAVDFPYLLLDYTVQKEFCVRLFSCRLPISSSESPFHKQTSSLNPSTSSLDSGTFPHHQKTKNTTETNDHNQLTIGELLKKGSALVTPISVHCGWSEPIAASFEAHPASAFTADQYVIPDTSLITEIQSFEQHSFDYARVKTRKVKPYLLSKGAISKLQQWQMVNACEHLYQLPYNKEKTGDIVQGLPKIDQFFEARKQFYHNPKTLAIKNFFFFRKRGLSAFLSTFLSFRNVQNLCAHSVQRVYQSQGISLSDKHIEIIVRRMTSYVLILHPGNTSLLPGEVVEYQLLRSLISPFSHFDNVQENSLQFTTSLRDGLGNGLGDGGRMFHQSKVVDFTAPTKDFYSSFFGEEKSSVIFLPYILGITKVSLSNYRTAFLSAASFQETRRILMNSALESCTDYLDQLKQPVMLGKTIPAGIAFFYEQL